MQKLSTEIEALYVGEIENRWPGRAPSAIGKKQVDGPLRIGFHGFELDKQADLKVHGGPDKAVHHYASDHYSFWQSKMPEHVLKFVSGGFGENIATFGVTENDICIGDVFEVGSAVVQISQGRQPCWKLNEHIGYKLMASHFQKTGRTGWYYRVLEIGEINAGDRLVLKERPNPSWTLDKVIAARFNPKVPKKVAEELAELPELANGWRKAFAKKLDKNFIESTDARLIGL